MFRSPSFWISRSRPRTVAADGGFVRLGVWRRGRPPGSHRTRPRRMKSTRQPEPRRGPDDEHGRRRDEGAPSGNCCRCCSAVTKPRPSHWSAAGAREAVATPRAAAPPTPPPMARCRPAAHVERVEARPRRRSACAGSPRRRLGAAPRRPSRCSRSAGASHIRHDSPDDGRRTQLAWRRVSLAAPLIGALIRSSGSSPSAKRQRIRGDPEAIGAGKRAAARPAGSSTVGANVRSERSAVAPRESIE